MVVDGRALVTQLGIGDTPLVPLEKVSTRGAVWLKAEYANPFGSAKDRTAAYLLASARATVGANVSVVESTSGNLGIALARIGHRIGVPVTLVMDGSLPQERIADVRHAGGAVRVVHEPRAGLTMRETRIAVALELGDREGCLWVNQYANESCVQAHRETTGPEMPASLRGDIDIVVASVGTGGTLCGISAAFRDLGHRALFVGVEPCRVDHLRGYRGRLPARRLRDAGHARDRAPALRPDRPLRQGARQDRCGVGPHLEEPSWPCGRPHHRGRDGGGLHAGRRA